MARLPFAPVRFSITTVQPRVSCRYWPRSRAEMSGAPPGGIVTSIRIGREGKEVWAAALALASAATAKIARPHAFGLMLPSDADWSFTIIGNSALEYQTQYAGAMSRMVAVPGAATLRPVIAMVHHHIVLIQQVRS